MKSWTNWIKLTRKNINKILPNVKGVYIIRVLNHKSQDSDIIYVGTHKSGKTKLRGRLRGLIRGMNATSEAAAKKIHSASWRIRGYKSLGLEFSWIGCFRGQEGVEKTILIAYWISNGKLPKCNKEF